jgi:hypothetical protein
MIDVSLRQAFDVSIAKSKYKNQREFCEDSGISGSSLQPMKKDSKCCQWRTINSVANSLGLSVIDFLKNGKIENEA